VFVIVRQLTRPLTGLLAALAFSLEPFIIKMNSINLLDTSAMLWMALGYAWLLTHRGPGSLPRWRVAAAGVSFALACLTKEMTVFPIVLSLFAAVVLRAGLRIRDVATILGVMVLVYVPYPVIAALSGHWEAFTASKSDGVLRFLGSVKISGFERGGDGPSFVAAVLENLDELATTYALIGVGLPAAAVLAWWGDTRKRLLGVWCAASFVLLAYGVGLGTLEEQFFYLLVVPALVATVVAADLVLERTRHRSAHRPAVVLVALAVIGSFAWAEATWRAVHFTSDNGYERLLAFLRDESTPDAPIAVTMETAKFLLVGYDRGAWNSPRELEANRARYVLLSTYEMDHGYGYASRDFYRWVAGRSELVFSFRRARNDDLLLLFRLPRTAAPQRARAQAGAITPRRP
jgi:4-amino-4-deoxy-L-arabinose transferase-like glycosyltransferase